MWFHSLFSLTIWNESSGQYETFTLSIVRRAGHSPVVLPLVPLAYMPYAPNSKIITAFVGAIFTLKMLKK